MDLTIKQVPPHLLGATVCEMWDHNLGWKRETFAEYLPISVLKSIQAYKLIDDESCNDAFFWNKAASGCFSIKSAIKLMHDPTLDEEHPDWKVIWAAKAQNRIKFFLWLALHNRLMCNEVRVARHLSNDMNCPLCHHHPESLLHALRDCLHARKLWLQF